MEKSKEEKNKLEGQIETLMKELKDEFDIKNIEEAEEEIEALLAEIEETESELEDKLNKLEDEFNVE